MAQKVKAPTDQAIGECGTTPPPPEKIRKIEDAIKKRKALGPAIKESSPLLVPIKAHIVRKSNGSAGLPVEVLITAIDTMNKQYLPMNMQFYLCGPIHYIDDDNLSSCDVEQDDKPLSQHNVNDAVNVYFCDVLTSGTAALNGISAFPSDNSLDNRIIMHNRATRNGTTLAHEMGHYWNLYHTHETFFGAELVTRESGANCTSAGDQVCDTPADPYSSSYDFTTCKYTDTVKKDANGELYNPDLTNLMSYYQLCRYRFSPGQFDRMRDGYLYRKSLMDQTGNYTIACQSDVTTPTNLTAEYLNCAVTLRWTDNADNEGGYIIERSTNPDGNFVAVGRMKANVTEFTDISIVAQPGRTYFYRVVAANSNAIYSSPVAVPFDTQAIYCYCTPGSTDCSDSDVITGFSILHDATPLLNNTSDCSPNGYINYTSTVAPATLTRGRDYTFSLQNPGRYREGLAIWLDYNQNRVFEQEEIIFSLQFVSTEPIIKGSFTVPDSVKLGTTRLRVRLQYNQTPTDPCISSGSNWGETEDYAITIAPRPAISSAASGSWNATNTWSCNCVPTIKDHVVIEAGHTVTVDTGNARARSLEVKDGASIHLGQDVQLNFQE
ncbi:hypothetical protein GCM10027291_11190 [Telluribacter humicola]